MDLPTPDDTSPAEDHADAGRCDRPAGAHMPLACAVAVAILYLLGRLFRDTTFGAMTHLFAWTILFFAASTYLLRDMMRLLPAAVSAGWPRFFALGCLSNLAVLIGAFLCGCLLGSYGFGFGGVGGGGGPVGGRPDAPTGIEGGLNAMGYLIVFFYLLPFVPLVVWITAVAAYKADAEGPTEVDPDFWRDDKVDF